MNVKIPDRTFTHTQADAVVTLSASQTNGQPLPSWVTFDSATGTLSGTPPADFRGPLDVQVTARDKQGNQATSSITLRSRGAGA